MAVNLLRNARVFFTHNVNTTTGEVLTGVGVSEADHSNVYTNAAFTQELQVLDGFSFSQNTTAETINLNESGSTPNRGSRSFNTSLEPVDWSFSTYIRPEYAEGGAVEAGLGAGDLVKCEERVLWNALFSANLIGQTDAAYSETAATSGTTTPFATITSDKSEVNQLVKFGLVIVFDDQTWVIDNCAIESLTMDFGLDQIGTLQWSGRGTKIRRIATHVTTATAGTFGGGFVGTYAQKSTTAKYIINKLSTAKLISAANLFGLSASKTYDLAITGGSLTVANNLTYLTPQNIGVLNSPIGYFTGARTISGNLTAYLRTATSETAELLNQVITSGDSSPENMFAITIGVGGSTTIPTTTSSENKLVVEMPTCMLQIPQVNTEQVVTTTINFNAQAGTINSSYDIEKSNEMTVKYFSGPAI